MGSKRNPPGPPPIEIKPFTLDDINRGVNKLRRRIEDVRRLEADGVSHDDHRRYNVEQAIDSTIMEVFGQNSHEYRNNQNHRIWHGTGQVAAPFEEPDWQGEFEAGIPQTITMLEGLIARLEEKRADLGQDAATRVRSAFEGLDLHPRIASVSADLYRDGHYRNAVLDASLALVNMVKEKSRRSDLDGSGLITTVFSKNGPILAVNDLKDQTDLDEQEGMMHLFIGAVLALRNPRAHTLLDDSPEMALEYIALLSLLAKRVDQAKRIK